MKTYKLMIPTKFNGGKIAGFEKIIITPDAKRSGMYKSTCYLSTDGYKRGYSHLYGKCNQEYLLNMIKEADEI